MKVREVKDRIAINVMMDGKKTFVISATRRGDIYEVWYVLNGVTLCKTVPVGEFEDLEVEE